MKLIPICLLLGFCINICVTVYAQAVDKQDSLALVDLYKNSNGSKWYFKDNWLTRPVRTWYGITVANRRVTEIDLSFNSLNGSIPASIGNLVNLQYLNLSGNQLSGTIPSTIGNLINLNSLYLGSNQLSGTIPSSIGNLVNLLTLNLDNNQLSGAIPSSLGNLKLLQYLYLDNNQLSGAIPSSIGNFVNINTLILTNNKLTGGIPSSLGNLARVVLLDLGNNQLSGAIPTSLGNLVSLHFLYLYNNQLSGAIPSSLGNLVNMSTLILRDNKLSGNIPSSFGNLAQLGTLYLNNNQLSGTIPSSLGDITRLYELHLNNNQLGGAIPSSLGNLVNLYFSLRLDHNQLSGSIPSSLGNLVHLRGLDLSYNKLGGTIPSSFTNLESLRQLKLLYNNFTFNGMEMVAETFPLAIYNNQALIPIHQRGNALSVSAGGVLSHNTYKWFWGASRISRPIMVATISGDSVFHPSQSGLYYVEVSNSVATDLTLKSQTISYLVSSVLNMAAVVSSEHALQQPGRTNTFVVYPNPARDILHVQTNSTASFLLADQFGKILLTTNISSKGIINVSGFSAGTYYLKNISSGAVRKIIIAR